MGQLLAAFAVMGVCVAIHLLGGFALLLRIQQRQDRPFRRPALAACTLMFAVFAGLLLLHTMQIALWAVLYRWQLGWTFDTAMYFSVVTYATIGYGDVVPPEGWRVAAAVEGLSGVLMLGWSSAIVFAVVNRLFLGHRERIGTRGRQ